MTARKTPTNRPTGNEYRTVPAGQLNAMDHIDTRVVFDTRIPGPNIQIRVTAQLRQISHNSVETTINVCDFEEEGGCLDEFTLSHDTIVEVHDL